jgi:hypothetical protein
MIKEQIGGGLGCAPGVTLLEWGDNLACQRMSLLLDARLPGFSNLIENPGAETFCHSGFGALSS